MADYSQRPPWGNNSCRQTEWKRRKYLENRARKTLGLSEGASLEDIKRAWRRLCFATHPDRNPGDKGSAERFRTAYCAYQFLVDGTLGHELSDAGENVEISQPCGKYNLANTWGYYLWWREAFFDL
jgi:hypothetical protein